MCFTVWVSTETTFLFPAPNQKEPVAKPRRWQLKIALWAALSLAGLSAIAAGLYFLTTLSNTSCSCPVDADENLISAQLSPPASASAQLSQLDPPAIQTGFSGLYADINGAVAQPGIYQLKSGARLADLIQQAGGLTAEADATFVTQELNLAQKLTDELKFYIPTQAEREYEQAAAEFCQNLATPTSANAQDSGATTQISINQASAEELQGLTGIGEKRAEDIIAGRPYIQINDLVEQKILTQRIFDELQNQLKL